MTTLNQVRSSLHSALERIGHRNSHTCPVSKSNVDPVLHELFVSHEGLSHFDKRRKLAIAEAKLVAGQSEIDAVVPGTEQSVIDGEHYSLVIKRDQPAKRIDRAKISTELRKLGFSEDKATAFMLAIVSESKPATSIRAVPKL